MLKQLTNSVAAPSQSPACLPFLFIPLLMDELHNQGCCLGLSSIMDCTVRVQWLRQTQVNSPPFRHTGALSGTQSGARSTNTTRSSNTTRMTTIQEAARNQDAPTQEEAPTQQERQQNKKQQEIKTHQHNKKHQDTSWVDHSSMTGN